MGFSTCPGCGSTVEHGDDGVEFYSHVSLCPDVNDPKLRRPAVVDPGLDALFKELQEAGEMAGETAGRRAAESLLRSVSGDPLTLAHFAGAVVDEFFKLEEDVSLNKLLKILSMIPAIIGTVVQAEQTIVGQGKGPEKLNLVLNTVNAAVAAVPEVQQSLAGHDLNGTVTAIVAGAVSAINAAKGPQGSGQA